MQVHKAQHAKKVTHCSGAKQGRRQHQTCQDEGGASAPKAENLPEGGQAGIPRVLCFALLQMGTPLFQLSSMCLHPFLATAGIGDGPTLS